jgi:hypothetical protein
MEGLNVERNLQNYFCNDQREKLWRLRYNWELEWISSYLESERIEH